jgi:hypothetical protein
MPDQLDLFGTAAPSPPPPAWDSAANVKALLAKPPRVRPLASVSADSLAAIAGVEMLREIPEGEFPETGTSWPLVAVGRAGWEAAMAHREHLVRQQLAGTLTPGDREALAALQHAHLHTRPWLDTPSETALSASAYDHLQQALAGLRWAATPACAACAGTGRSSFDDPETTAQQAALRAEAQADA